MELYEVPLHPNIVCFSDRESIDECVWKIVTALDELQNTVNSETVNSETVNGETVNGETVNGDRYLSVRIS